ncbi:acyltransferase family protein [Acidicapsa ligni]|uniref:acyltransferase family protein n=1 Tax=Acidicapsa ligni TaxID=542300 RepID=UPI0021E036CA|nr:acyltransferase family protein [Acidicapsa ligni]
MPRTAILQTAQRDFYIDRLRSVMTALVILHHTAITYGGPGGWFWREIETSPTPSSTALTFFCATNQAYFMGFFFLLAGYFTPRSLERKGTAQFLLDRFLRLGLPLLAFILILGPLTAAIVTAFEGHGFWPTIVYLRNHQRIINGPLWFAEALLIFSLIYCAWSAAVAKRRTTPQTPQRSPRPVPAYSWWLLAAVGTGVTALAIRQFVPTGENVFGLQLGYFASYIVLFAVGIAAWRHDWLRQLRWRDAQPWLFITVIAWPFMPVGIVLARKLYGPGRSNFSGGFSWTAILYAFWEPLIAWGIISLWLLVFREHMNKPSAIWDWLNRRAYAVYILHPPVLVTIGLLLHHWTAPALLKFGVTGILSVAATWLISDPIVRLPGIRKIV